MESNPLHVVINVVPQVPPFLTIILEVVARAVCPPLKSSLLLADILRITSEYACSLLVYYMSSTCPAASAVKLRCISRIVSVTNPLRQRSECKIVLDHLIRSLFQFRLECPLKLEWDIIDSLFRNSFQNEGDLLVFKEPVLSAFQRVINVSPSIELKVCRLWFSFCGLLIVIKALICTYLRHASQNPDAEFLMSLKESIEQLPAGKVRDDFLESITSNPRHSNSTQATTKAKSQKGRLVMAPHIWREHVQNLVHDIISPDSLHWMDDDDGMSVSHICQRSLQEVQIRFDQCVHSLCY